MRDTIVETASGDELFHSLAATIVILGNISYCDLDEMVWDKSDYDQAVIGKESNE